VSVSNALYDNDFSPGRRNRRRFCGQENSPPHLRSRSWTLPIRGQRLEVAAVLEESPSLRGRAGKILAKAYTIARLAAERETGLPEQTFPADCPWTLDQVMTLDLGGQPA
jgi:hypothetical protein